MRSHALLCVPALLAAAYWPASEAQTTAAIFKCEIDGVPTFSDRPCAPSAQLQELDLERINSHEAPSVRAASAAKRQAPVKRKPASSSNTAKQVETCERLAQSLQGVRAKLRSGYSAKEGERLNEREAQLKSQLRSARCG
jgi:hypothetical protein